MHRLQHDLLRLAATKNLGNLKLREIGRLVGEDSPQKIKHHLHQLEKRGLIRVDKSTNTIQRVKAGTAKSSLSNARLLAIPILGAANAGPATLLAEQNVEGYLKVSSTFVRGR